MDFTKIKEGLKNLIDEKTSPEKAQAIGDLMKEIDQTEKDATELAEKTEEMRLKYIDAVKNSTFGTPSKQIGDEQPKTLEECAKATIQARSKN